MRFSGHLICRGCYYRRSVFVFEDTIRVQGTKILIETAKRRKKSKRSRQTALVHAQSLEEFEFYRSNVRNMLYVEEVKRIRSLINEPQQQS